MTLNAEVIGLPQLLARLDKRRLVDEPLEDYFGDVAADTFDSVVSSSPVRTGLLRGSWRKEVPRSPAGGEVSNPVRYAPFQAFGTRHHPPAGFWHRGIAVAEASMKARVAALARDVERRFGGSL